MEGSSRFPGFVVSGLSGFLVLETILQMYSRVNCDIWVFYQSQWNSTCLVVLAQAFVSKCQGLLNTRITPHETITITILQLQLPHGETTFDLMQIPSKSIK